MNTVMTSWRRAAVRHWRLKLGLTFGLSTFFGLGYFSLQQVHGFNARELPLLPIDHWVSFSPDWVLVYQSLYLLLPIFPWISRRRSDLQRYARGFVGVSVTGFFVFAVFPVACPRPEVVPTEGMFAWLVGYDAVGNAFPSLHVALATYSVLYGLRTLGDEGFPRRRALAVGLWIWVGLIAYSTLATKQHYFMDLPAGFGLALWGHWATWRSASREGFSLRVRAADSDRSDHERSGLSADGGDRSVRMRSFSTQSVDVAHGRRLNSMEQRKR